MRRTAGAALTEAEYRAPAQAQGLGAVAPASPWQTPSKLLHKSGATVVQKHAASLAREVPAASLLQGCTQRYAPPAEHHVDPFGILGLVDLWPANSTARVRPRPLPFGPAYNSSEFDLFTNVSLVCLVSLCPARSAYCRRARMIYVTALAEHALHSVQGRPALTSDGKCVQG